MPYITRERRKELLEDFPKSPGDLNYIFSDILYEYWLAHKNYQGINDIIGALEACKLEFYRRVVVPYEEEKREVNGDVY